MVSVDEDGKPIEVPRIEFVSDVEEKLFEAGKMRCAMRKEIQERNNKLHVSLDNWIKLWNWGYKKWVEILQKIWKNL